jgi:hypothetical protein
VATQNKPKETILTVTVANNGTADAANVVVRFLDGSTMIGDSTALATLARGASAQLSVTWDTRGIQGDHVVVARADPNNMIAESNENNNTAQRTITIRGNKITNGSFEQSSNATTPDGWSGTQGTAYDTTGANASDGSRSVRVTGNGGAATLLNPSWTSAPIDVAAGQTYRLAMTVKTQGLSSAPSLQVTFLDAAGTVLNKVTGITTSITGDTAAQEVLGQITLPPGVTQVRLTLTGFSALDPATHGSAWFDDIWMW